MQNRAIRCFASGGLICLSAVLIACQPPGQNAKDSGVTRRESHLVLNNATLEQSNAKGQTVWKVQVREANYSPDRKKADLQEIRGNLFQDGKLVLQVSADRGEIVKDGSDISLKENIIAKDPRNGIVIRADAIHWQPEQDLVRIPNNFRGSQAKLEVSAKEGRYYTRKQRLELIGQIVATAKNPRLQLKTERLYWNIPQHQIIGDRRLEIVRYQDKEVTDRLVTNRSEIDINKNSVLIQDNVEFKSLDPPLQMSSNFLLWNYQDRTVKSDQPIQLFHYRDGIKIVGNRAQINLTQKVAQLYGGVEGSNSRTQAKLYAEKLTWNIAAQVLEAVGNVTYEQSKPPQFHLTGERATGRLQDNSMVVTGGDREQVVTEIVPQ
jgi:LPS export ABC transporter protein LptC